MHWSADAGNTVLSAINGAVQLSSVSWKGRGAPASCDVDLVNQSIEYANG